MNLYRIIYMSRNEMLGTAEEIEQSVAGILASSRVWNSSVDVSGVLLFNNGAFVQVLEGPLENVTKTFEKIQCDTRHSEVIVLEAGEVSERSFTDWAMAYVGSDAHDAARYSMIKLGIGAMLKMRGDDLLGRLPDILREEERELS